MRKIITHDKWLKPDDKDQLEWVIQRLIQKRILQPDPVFHHDTDYEHALIGLRKLVQTEEGKKQFTTMKSSWSRRQNREKRSEKEHIKTFTFEAHRRVEGAINQLKKNTGLTKNNLFEQIILEAQVFKNEIKASLEKDYQKKKEKLNLKAPEKIVLDSKLKKLHSELAFTQNILQNKIDEISRYKTLLEDQELLNHPLSSQQEERAWNSYLALMNSYEKQLQTTISDATANKEKIHRNPIEPISISSKAAPMLANDLRKASDAPNEMAAPHSDTQDRKTPDVIFPSKSDPIAISQLREDQEQNTKNRNKPKIKAYKLAQPELRRFKLHPNQQKESTHNASEEKSQTESNTDDK